MKTVFLYGGTGKYSGTAAFEWNCPEVGNTHRFILFVAQENNEAQQQVAINELEQFGFTELQVGEGKPIAVEVLNEPQMKAFQKHYEGALAEGSSIVWYP
jgi:hypothetical protein